METKKIGNKILKKKKKGSKGMAGPNSLISDYSSYNHKKYLNISVGSSEGHAGMVEWLSQSFDKRCPFGVVGSIPAAGVTNHSDENINKMRDENIKWK